MPKLDDEMKAEKVARRERERSQRLAKALRTNLIKRKDQARARDEEPDAVDTAGKTS